MTTLTALNAISQITNDMPSGILIVDPRGRIIAQNRASERIFGGMLTNGLLSDVVLESRELQEMVDRCLKTGEVFTRVEFNVPGEMLQTKRIGINLSPVTGENGTIQGALCLLSDLTEIVELQRQIKLKDNFAALGEMSAGIAHEFKNSIATIMGYSQLSVCETNVEVLQSYAREIQKESKSMSTIITDFLNFARPVHPSIIDVDLIELLENVIADVRNQRPGCCEILREFRSKTAILPCDATLMRQLFVNLLLNAIDATRNVAGKGCIRVKLEETRERDARTLSITIEDNGSGIPVANLTKIFLPFFTTKPQGTGLGLSLAQKIVIAHNGRIEARQADPLGTQFVISLPLPS
jgi:two-component system sensor histidine kinase AtoS